MYVGEGEALLRNTFRRARLAAPSILFFDEADVVAAKRVKSGGSSSGSVSVGERLLSTLLTEMDGLEQTKGILVLAATNRAEAIDAALMRPGRFDLVLYVPPPDLEGRYEILRVLTRNMKLGPDVDLKQIAKDTELFTGAELEGLCREAAIVALREDMNATIVCDRHFQIVRGSLKPALTREIIEKYSSFMNKSSPKVHVTQPTAVLRSKCTPKLSVFFDCSHNRYGKLVDSFCCHIFALAYRSEWDRSISHLNFFTGIPIAVFMDVTILFK